MRDSPAATRLEAPRSISSAGLSETKRPVSSSFPSPVALSALLYFGCFWLLYRLGDFYETFFDDYPEFGSVCSGGRYENLSSVFMDKKFPGVGISIGLTRLFDQLRGKGLLKIGGPTPNKALIVVQNAAYQTQAVTLAGELRRHDIAADVFLRECKFKKKMEYANKIKVPYLIIIGEDEAAQGNYTLKNMQTGDQQRLKLDELIKAVAA